MSECKVCGLKIPEFLVEKHKARHKGGTEEKEEEKS